MQNDYLRIEDVLSLVSHKWSIVKYVDLKKIRVFFLCFDSHLDSNLLDSDLTSIVLVLDLSWTRQRWT